MRPDGNALYKTPKGVMWRGKSVVKDNTACVDWQELPNNACVKYDKQGDTISIINATTGQTRTKVLKIVVENAEHLAPLAGHSRGDKEVTSAATDVRPLRRGHDIEECDDDSDRQARWCRIPIGEAQHQR